ncbi:3-hydroxyacyl-ACP dehydratase FabZ [Myxococcus sp. CA051A]|uniref:3-hydroxyacyl-[acyl-carrier-protein] dehydratase FabZ n=1 Tax=Myxococcus llanfairpwllgwyngyllgogerychwyrndrobwllllantysiliogogogochensis TaxID=2590453 RepID=A0A540WLH3_9BACT|nr:MULTISPECIES: 3-hydroxyacyl-ACP dehydratase FabZ [Myxococcus]MCP3169162.1 3-hydroxyacyl-ACP dehydratase FabZ [Myxococcus qinghaiensis]NTX08430.1 3-hydroxyacyl-ACP dehydratase FabZ [Myxococcus sp. CA040A]NTX16705.1 3-hydroxyacyl-ACP dehydratase FabZ [Myxococcus sp. CA056]NTX41165.1 3-hydroxyacyl-ACP dehydratase FabZ [Myxococcus sp. CA033]NTX53998.1 3-hydroxyacyl-ACP dehydratase FabZ [Myxococcus sp. CA039A]
MDIGEIQNLLPHRYPFLLIDRVVEIVPGQKITAYKNVTINEPFFNGHFPGHPVMPGVLILEALAQASAILAYKSENMDPTQKVTYLMGVDGARFRKPVVPGDRLQLLIEVLRHKGAVWKTKGTATVDGVKVAEGEFLATVVDKNKDAGAAEGAAS